MSRKKKLSEKGLAKKDCRQFVRRLRKYFKDMPKGYNPYQSLIEPEPLPEESKEELDAHEKRHKT